MAQNLIVKGCANSATKRRISVLGMYISVNEPVGGKTVEQLIQV